FLRFYEAAYRRVRPGLFVGGGFNVNSRYNIRAGGTESSFDHSAYASYTERHGFAPDHQSSAGGNVAMRYDTRDNAINAERGWLAAATYRTFFKGFVGGDATYQQLSIDVRAYKPLTKSGSQRIAFWMVGDLVTGGVAPFLDLPTTGSDARSGRGYTEGRNRGEHLAYGEIEYRGALTPSGLAGFVAFFNTTTIGSSETGARLFENAAPAAGVGLRLLLNKRSRTNFYTDWGWGTDGSRGFYLGIQEAF
ncbi:MAG TPA: BamA/TamA family outer membrane protein, partial [Vicinamibacterales bacterium]|nr:BamA/TamA family outer membrane protein [Vicinamibacterales bacterium]